jgi:hypothetical protein
MPNITTTVADIGGFLPQVWAQRALDVLKANMVMARLIAKDSDYEPAFQGKTLNIPYPGTFTAQEKAADTAITPQTPTGGATVSVTLTKHKAVDFLVEDVARAQARPDLLDTYIRPAALAIAEAVESDIMALQLGLSTEKGTIGTDINAATIRTARQTLNDARVPPETRYLVVSAKDEIALLGDSSLTNYFAFSRTQGIAEGSIGRLYGFDVYLSQLVPVGKARVSLGSPTGGNFTLTFRGATTGNIAYNATASAVKTALEGLSTVGTGNVDVAGTAGGPYTVTWTGTLAGTTSKLTGNGAGLTGGTFAITDGYTNLAFQRDAFLLATRPFMDPPPSAGVQAASVRDPDTGLVIRVIYTYDLAYRGVRVGLDILYGVVKLRDAFGVRVMS